MSWRKPGVPLLSAGIAMATVLVLAGCGVSVTGTSASPQPAPARSAPPAQQKGGSSSTAGRNEGPTVTLTGTLGSSQRASFSAWVGGRNASGQWVWVPVTVELDSGAPITNVDGHLLNQYGFQSNGQTMTVSGFGGGTVTGYEYTGLTLVPTADPTQAIAANKSWYSGIGASGLTSDFQVNVGEDILQQGHFSIQGQSWSFAYVPAETLSTPPSSSASGTPPSSGGSGQSNGAPPASAGAGYLGVEVTNPPSDWTVTGCEVTTTEGGSPAAQAGLIGSTQRTDPVGDVINQVTDNTQGWGPIAISSCAGLAAAMADTRPGDQITLGYYHRHVFILGSWVPETVVLTLTAWPLGLTGGGGTTF